MSIEDEETDPDGVKSSFDESVTTFIDYIEPPRPKPPPPAKWKLWLLVFVLVYVASWFATEADFFEALRFHGWLGPTAALFVQLAVTVFVMVFAALDLAVTVFTVNIGGRRFGVGPWLKQGRWTWIHQQKNVVVEVLSCIVEIFEDGFSMFDGAPPSPTTTTVPEEKDDERQFACEELPEECNVLLKIEHRISASKLGEYREWSRKIGAACRRQRGLVHVRTTSVTLHEDEGFEEDPPGQSSNDDGEEDSQSEDSLLHTIYVTFENIERLNDWMTSHRRRELLTELEPLLARPDIVQIRNDRHLPDAFTDLLVRQGEPVPSLTPKKWKVWWLTTIGLFFVQLWSNDAMPYYIEQWGMDNVHERLRSLVLVLISTFLNSYVMTPLLLFLFSPWVKRKEDENDTRQPWKTLNDGFGTFWSKALLTISLYGGFAIAWAMRPES